MKSKYEPDTVAKMVVALQTGLSTREACEYANIHRDTHYMWLKSKKGYSDKIYKAKTFLGRRSKEIIANAILDRSDVKLAKWYLERRDPEYR